QSVVELKLAPRSDGWPATLRIINFGHVLVCAVKLRRAIRRRGCDRERPAWRHRSDAHIGKRKGSIHEDPDVVTLPGSRSIVVDAAIENEAYRVWRIGVSRSAHQPS